MGHFESSDKAPLKNQSESNLWIFKSEEKLYQLRFDNLL